MGVPRSIKLVLGCPNAKCSDWVPKFGGHQSLLEREETYHAKDQTLHCGFVKAPDGKPETGFELSKDDKEYLSHCHIAISSCIFGSWDNLRTPTNKKVRIDGSRPIVYVNVERQLWFKTILDGQY